MRRFTAEIAENAEKNDRVGERENGRVNEVTPTLPLFHSLFLYALCVLCGEKNIVVNIAAKQEAQHERTDRSH
jgi:hypothetical protein